MAGHRCLDVESRVVSSPLIVECHLTCEVALNWEVLYDAEGVELNDANSEIVRCKREQKNKLWQI